MTSASCCIRIEFPVGRARNPPPELPGRRGFARLIEVTAQLITTIALDGRGHIGLGVSFSWAALFGDRSECSVPACLWHFLLSPIVCVNVYVTIAVVQIHVFT